MVNQINIVFFWECLKCHQVNFTFILIENDLDSLVYVEVFKLYLLEQFSVQCFRQFDCIELAFVESLKLLEVLVSLGGHCCYIS